MLDLTSAELAELRPALSGVPAWATPGALISAWRDFVTEVEHGFEQPLYEYVNELGSRDVLERLLNAASPRLREKLGAAVMPLDERFENATVPARNCLGSDSTGKGAWWYRYPIRLEDVLREDLVDADLI